MAGSTARRQVVRPRDAVWLVVLPCLAVVLGAIVVLGPLVGRVAFPPAAGLTFWPGLVRAGLVLPEPAEHGRYLVALTAPLLLAGVTLGAARRGWGASSAPGWRVLGHASRAFVPLFLVLCIVAQRRFGYGRVYGNEMPQYRAYFTGATLAASALVAGLLAIALQQRAVVDRVVAAARDTRRLRIASGLAAALFTAVWLLVAVNSEGSIGNANLGVTASVPFWLDEPFGVLDGRTPLVNFVPQYSHLIPYATAGVMSVFGASFGTFAATMVLASAASLLCIYAVLRRVVGNALGALALYVVFVSTGFFTLLGPPDNRYDPANLFSAFPMRYGGPYVLAWLTARWSDGSGRRLRPLLFLAAGLVAINNVEFGIPALGATIAAALVTNGRLTRRGVTRLLGDLAAGIAGALVLVCLLTLAGAGSWPDFGLLFRFSKIYGVGGFGLLPMPTLGFHLVVYATFAAAVVVAAIRAFGRERDALLTGMLAWSGVFGLGAGSYFVGRSHSDVLVDLFSAWAFALVLLVVVAVREIRAGRARATGLPVLALLVTFAIAACSVAQTPLPWIQIARLSRVSSTPLLRDERAEQFVAARTRRGEHVLLLTTLGHRIAYDLHLSDVAPYASVSSMPTVQQLEESVGRLRAAGGRRVFLDERITAAEVIPWLVRDGFSRAGADARGIAAFTDARHG